ncbi:phosphoglycerate kinase [Phenylobacterium sp. Root77]|uniref:histidine phosphatase family protein n=1 Tax=unclassified Phenylobacterium TaxID=2640670 RepID=UPI0006F5B05B|nr:MULTISPECIES: histidine phosphatase family protein [unclassified Phenylobacterium]KQW73483.1 phosphoglycerate kinase [Phenylobacterium sp. Root1277]KQW92702.1 phosphoglycerate kinase [Phenylobacterium sp. Root1290]KRC40930.1 phosphoglycerate kinase [Phenylobacterium sp. Root77]
MKDIFVVTHAESLHHVEDVVGGWHDTSLTERGRRQADAIAARVAELVDGRAVEIYASDLKRAYETAEPIGARLGVPIVADPDLREISYGVAGGKPQAWLDERIRFPSRDGDRLDNRMGVEGAETKREFATRVYRGVDRVIAGRSPTAVIVTHGFAMTFVVARWIGLPIENAGHVNFRAGSGGITHLREEDMLQNRGVQFLNDLGHMAGL